MIAVKVNSAIVITGNRMEYGLVSGTPAKRTGEQAQEIAATLRERIVERRIGAGSPLRQESLAELFGTSRMPIRDALRLLEAEGLVLIEPNHGAKNDFGKRIERPFPERSTNNGRRRSSIQSPIARNRLVPKRPFPLLCWQHVRKLSRHSLRQQT